VTLVELLITIMIITILAGLVLGVAAVAGETARQAQSRHIVERLHTLLTDYYDTY
jgi:type II secretory pathway pseudopilin PulG